jgi:hypothetical protein
MKNIRFLSQLSIFTAALLLLDAARAEQPTAAPVFLRSSETDAKLSAIQTGTIEFRPMEGNGPSVWLVSVAHLGTPEYYQAIQKRLETMTVVLFEGVGLAEEVKQGPGTVNRDAGIQKQLSDALGLRFQLDAIDYRRPNFVNSDLPVEDVQKEVEERAGAGDETKTNETFNMLMQAIQGSGQAADMLKPMMAFLTATPEMRETTRLMLIEVLARAEEMVALVKNVSPEMKDLFEVLLTERNAIVMRDLHTQLARLKSGESVAIFYGAAHMPELAKHLRTEFKYAPGTVQWDTAFTADPTKSAIQPAQMRLMLDMLRTQLQNGGAR